MPSFFETFTDLSNWTFGATSPTTHLEISALHATNGPTSARSRIEFGTVWAAHRLDLVDGGDPTKTYWISYTIYIDDWANFEGMRSGFAIVPLAFEYDSDPDNFNILAPYITATSATTGTIQGIFGGAPVAFTDNAWHTVRYGARFDGAASTEELWLDGVQIANNSFTDVSQGALGIWMGGGDQSVEFPPPVVSYDGFVYVDAITWDFNVDPGEPPGGSTETGAGGSGSLSGRRFFESLPWRCVVADGNLDPFGEPYPSSGGTITMLDRLASNRRMNVAIGKPRTFECDVPSDSPEVNISYTDLYAEAFLAEGNRLLYVFRREGDYTTDPNDNPWVIRGSFIIMQIEDSAESEDARSRLVAYDPRQLLYSRRAINPVTQEEIGSGGFTYFQERAGIIAYNTLRDSLTSQGSARIINSLANVALTPRIFEFNIQQGMTVGEVWDELEATGLVEIYLDPIYDPVNVPGFLCEAFYEEMGSDNPAAIFAWDKPSRSLVGVSNLVDGTQRVNKLLYGVGQGGPVVNLVQDADSVQKYGEYWGQQWFPVQRKKATVQALADGEVEARKKGRHTVSISPVAERSPIPLLDYELGDQVQVAWSNNLRQPLVRAPNWSRIVEIPIDIDDDALESVQQAIVEPLTTIFPLTRIALGGPDINLAGGPPGGGQGGVADLKPPAPGRSREGSRHCFGIEPREPLV